jgi:hypothetical protein
LCVENWIKFRFVFGSMQGGLTIDLRARTVWVQFSFTRFVADLLAHQTPPIFLLAIVKPSPMSMKGRAQLMFLIRKVCTLHHWIPCQWSAGSKDAS